MKYDVIIVGGGPAGSTAGINLAGSGLRVAILDRARFPRLKPCGGGISHRVYRRFPYLEPVLRRVPTNFVNRVIFESPAGDAVEIERPEPLYAMIRRIEFDHALLNECRQRGIEVKEGVTVSRVEVREDGVCLTSLSGEQFLAEVVIGADGVNSVVARHSGLRGPWKPSQIAIDGTEESPSSGLSVRQDTMYIYFGIGGGHGYGYLFPKACHVNFGIGYLLEFYKRNVKEKPYEHHLSFFKRLSESGVISGNSQPANFHAYVLPVGGPLDRISSNRILLAEDAAGFVNGFTAEGIYYAMVSGEHAGKTAMEAVNGGNVSAEFLRRYDNACSKEVGYELRKSVSLRKVLFSNPKTIDNIVRFAIRSKAARALMTSFAVGELSYKGMRKRAVLEAFPAYLRYKVEKILKRG